MGSFPEKAFAAHFLVNCFSHGSQKSRTNRYQISFLILSNRIAWFHYLVSFFRDCSIKREKRNLETVECSYLLCKICGHYWIIWHMFLFMSTHSGFRKERSGIIKIMKIEIFFCITCSLLTLPQNIWFYFQLYDSTLKQL